MVGRHWNYKDISLIESLLRANDGQIIGTDTVHTLLIALAIAETTATINLSSHNEQFKVQSSTLRIGSSCWALLTFVLGFKCAIRSTLGFLKTPPFNGTSDFTVEWYI
jgi:hypothetical protein